MLINHWSPRGRASRDHKNYVFMINPIRELYKDGVPYAEMNRISGVPINTIYEIRNKIDNNNLNFKLSTALDLVKAGVDWTPVFDVFSK